MKDRHNYLSVLSHNVFDGVEGAPDSLVWMRDDMEHVSYYGSKPRPFVDHPFQQVKTLRYNWRGDLRLSNDLPFPHSRETSGVLQDRAVGAELLDETDTYNRAISNLYEEIRGGVDLSIDAFQASQTLALAKSLWTVYRCAKRFDLNALYHEYNTWRKVAGNISNLWLQWIYGMKPLIDDVTGASVQAMRATERAMNIKLRSSDHNEIIRTQLTGNLANSIPFWHITESQRQFCNVNGNLRYKFSGEALETASRFTSLNPFSIGWELLPFSFVFDWAYNVGGYLRSMESAILSNSSFSEGWLTINQMTYGEGIATLAYDNGPYGLGSGKGDCFEKISKKRRIKLIASPLPRAPVWKSNFLGPIRAANAIALLGSTFKPK